MRSAATQQQQSSAKLLLPQDMRELLQHSDYKLTNESEDLTAALTRQGSTMAHAALHALAVADELVDKPVPVQARARAWLHIASAQLGGTRAGEMRAAAAVDAPARAGASCAYKRAAADSAAAAEPGVEQQGATLHQLEMLRRLTAQVLKQPALAEFGDVPRMAAHVLACATGQPLVNFERAGRQLASEKSTKQSHEQGTKVQKVMQGSEAAVRPGASDSGHGGGAARRSRRLRPSSSSSRRRCALLSWCRGC
jgi:hypothetical protein